MFREWKALFLEGLPIYEDEVVSLVVYINVFSLVDRLFQLTYRCFVINFIFGILFLQLNKTDVKC